MTDFRQQEGALRRAADVTADARRSFDVHQRRLAGDIAGMRAQWRGQGGLAFQRVHEAWQEKQTRITAALDGLETALRETERDNLATDQSQADHLATFAARL